MVGRRTALSAASVTLAVTALVVLGYLYALGPFAPTGDYDWATVTVIDENGETLATVDVRIADTTSKRYTGLSETESLDADEGMLFIHDREGRHAYVMRGMDFPLDIVFVDANGTVTRVHHASLPPPGTSGEELTRYPGRGKYVLELPYGYTNRTGISVGDRVVVPSEYR